MTLTSVLRHEEVSPVDLEPFPQIKLSPMAPVASRQHLPYLLVMPRATEGDLLDEMSHMNAAGKNRALAIGVVAVGVAKALQYINGAGVMHGDVKPRNFVPLKNWKGYAIIDLDTAACTAAKIDGTQLAAQNARARVVSHQNITTTLAIRPQNGGSIP